MSADPKEFVAVFAAEGLRLPVAVASDDPGLIVDSDNNAVCTIDVWAELDNAKVRRIAGAIALAINGVGGFGGAAP